VAVWSLAALWITEHFFFFFCVCGLTYDLLEFFFFFFFLIEFFSDTNLTQDKPE
jgi:hypothetical protein